MPSWDVDNSRLVLFVYIDWKGVCVSEFAETRRGKWRVETIGCLYQPQGMALVFFCVFVTYRVVSAFPAFVHPLCHGLSSVAAEG